MKTQRKLLKKRDEWRNVACTGCRHNYYNFPKPTSPNGDVEVKADGCCWSLADAKKDRKTGKAKCNTSFINPGYRDSALKQR